MSKKRIAIACQGGGSQTAFTGGVLSELFDDGIHQDNHITGLSGTSGGALNASLAWYGLLRAAQGDETPISDRLEAFWHDIKAQHPLEILFDSTITAHMRMANAGFMPMWEISPYSFFAQWMNSALGSGVFRERFMDFKGALEHHIPFAELHAMTGPHSPTLLLGAANVKTGNLKIFSSANKEICVEAILASAAVPNVFPAVQIGDDFFWDGLFSANPPIQELVQPRYVGTGNIPDEVWTILINPLVIDEVPTEPADIVDRRNQMTGNISVLRDFETLRVLEAIYNIKGFSKEFFEMVGLEPDKFIKYRFIQMSEEVHNRLDYPSKLSRHPSHVEGLMEEGRKQAKAFLKTLSRPALTATEALKRLEAGRPAPVAK